MGAGHDIPRSHPRYRSLVTRERLVEGFREGLVVPQGLIAHGRGEAFDYILGERTHGFALEAERAAVAHLLTSRHPVISVNGNYAVLAAGEIGDLSRETGAVVEVNLFHRTDERVERLVEYLRGQGVERVLGPDCEKTRITGLQGGRSIVCVEGIHRADFVLLAMEDGDRTAALKREGKVIAAIDLNPFSRTAQTADITIVDEAARATRNMAAMARELKAASRDHLARIIREYDNTEVLRASFKTIKERLEEAALRGVL